MFNDAKMDCPPKISNDPLILNVGGHDVRQMKKSRENPGPLNIYNEPSQVYLSN